MNREVPEIAPASDNVVIKIPEELQPEIRVLVDSISHFAQARNPVEHEKALTSYDDYAVFDTPLLYFHGKDKACALYDTLKVFANADFTARVVRFKMMNEKTAIISIDGVFEVKPKRTIFLPLTYLLPSSVPMDTTIEMVVKGHNDKVGYVSGHLHNLPKLPYLLRHFWGWALGNTALRLQPIASRAWEMVDYGTQGLHTAAGEVNATMQQRLASLTT